MYCCKPRVNVFQLVVLPRLYFGLLCNSEGILELHKIAKTVVTITKETDANAKIL